VTRSYDRIVFDMDGTLMDSEAKIVRCIQSAARDAGVDVPGSAEARDIIGLGLTEAMQTLFPNCSADQRAQIVDHYRRHFLEIDDTAMPLFPGVADGLATLEKGGYLLAVATGKSRRGLERVLDETELRSRFVVSRCADESFSKPHPRMLREILDMTGVSAHRAIMVGDTIYDMEMARNAGVDGLAVTYGVHRRDVLIEHGALGCVDDFPGVCAWLTT